MIYGDLIKRVFFEFGSQIKMRVFPGSPGTLTSLFLRIAQCVFAAGSIASMATTTSFFNFTAFWYFPFALLYFLAEFTLPAIFSFFCCFLRPCCYILDHNLLPLLLFVISILCLEKFRRSCWVRGILLRFD